MNSGEIAVPLPEDNTEAEKNTCKMPILGSGHWFVWDPCGIVCAVMTYILIGYGELVVLLVLAPPFPTLGTALCVLIFTAFASLAVISHVRAMMTDPVSLYWYHKGGCGEDYYSFHISS
jgi:hypothetical protein